MLTSGSRGETAHHLDQGILETSEDVTRKVARHLALARYQLAVSRTKQRIKIALSGHLSHLHRQNKELFRAGCYPVGDCKKARIWGRAILMGGGCVNTVLKVRQASLVLSYTVWRHCPLFAGGRRSIPNHPSPMIFVASSLWRPSSSTLERCTKRFAGNGVSCGDTSSQRTACGCSLKTLCRSKRESRRRGRIIGMEAELCHTSCTFWRESYRLWRVPLF